MTRINALDVIIRRCNIKIKIPQKIKVGGHYVRTFYEAKLLDNHGKYAQSRFPELEIAVQERDMTESMKTQSWIHEVLHFIDKAYNNYSLNEETIDALASGIHGVLVDMGIEFDWSNIK